MSDENDLGRGRNAHVELAVQVADDAQLLPRDHIVADHIWQLPEDLEVMIEELHDLHVQRLRAWRVQICM